MSRKRVAVLFGGQSSEHEISCISAATVIENIDLEVYDLLLIGITKEGRWLLVDSVKQIVSGEWKNSKVSAVISPDAGEHMVICREEERCWTEKIDVAFPVLHGLYGEDGTVQGIFELAKLPYVGCGVLASAVSMDKVYTKQVVEPLGICQAAYVYVTKAQLNDMDEVVNRIEGKLDYPVFVKPSNAGSSQGVSKAHDRDELVRALTLAAEHDRKILVEETICGREVECAVLGDHGKAEASGIGEILAAADFYDYEAKYHNAESKTVLDPQLPEETVKQLREDAVRIFQAVDGFGLSRVDFFVENETGRVVFNEINTLPGFTSISMYPMLWERKGVDKKTLVKRLIEMAETR